MITSCGFTPIHKKHTTINDGTLKEIDVNNFLESINVEESTKDIANQQLASVLAKKLSFNSQQREKKYRLHTAVTTKIYEIAVQQNREATRYNQHVSAEYILTDIETFKIVNQDTIELTGSYDLNESEYATLVAERDTRKHLINQLSQELKIRLVQYYFSKKAQK